MTDRQRWRCVSFITVQLSVHRSTQRPMPYSTDHGRRWHTPKEPIPYPWANQRAARRRYGLSLVGALGWSRAGPERWLMSVPQVRYICWSFSYRFKPGAPPTAAWWRRRKTITALETSSCVPLAIGVQNYARGFPGSLPLTLTVNRST